MAWNYTKTWAILATVAVAESIVTQTGAGVAGAVFLLPAVIIADMVSWYRARRVTARAPE